MISKGLPFSGFKTCCDERATLDLHLMSPDAPVWEVLVDVTAAVASVLREAMRFDLNIIF
jgi:hypothetical protein